jgi:putative ABC transport system permease protein
MRTLKRGFRSFRRHPLSNLIVILLLFICLTFSLSMLAVKLAADSQTEEVKQRVGNYSEIRSSSSFQMAVFEQERGRSAAERSKEARTMTEEEELEERTKTLVPEELTDDFSREPGIVTYDKVLSTGITVPEITNTELESILSMAQGQGQRDGMMGGVTANTFYFEGNTDGASASDFMQGNKILIDGTFYTYADYLEANPVVLIEKYHAEDNELQVGDTVTALISGESGKDSEVELEIVGIYETVVAEEQSEAGGFTSFNPAGNKFFAPLSVVQDLNNTPGYVELGSYYFENVDFTAQLQETFTEDYADEDRYEFVTDFTEYEVISDPLEKVGKTSAIGLVGALGACALIILLAMAIIIGGRTRELGVLKAIGATDRQVITQYAVEVICVCLVSIILAMGATAIISQSIGDWLLTGSEVAETQAEEEAGTPQAMVSRFMERNLYKEGGQFVLTESETEEAELNVVYQGDLLLYGILILVGISLLGMAVPVIWITRLRPARVLSME